MITGKRFTENLYSENQEEKLYSTGDEMLDNLLERAFCEGYELAQKEFARRDYEGLSKEGQEDLRKMRGAIAKDLMSKRKWVNTMTNDITDKSNFIADGVNQYSKKLGKMFPESISNIKKIAERVSDNVNSSNNMRLNGRGEVFNVLQEKANDSARLARKYVEGKDKVRTTIGRIAKNM